MKIPQARELPSGSWFIRVQVDGKTVSITKNTEAECIAEASALKARVKEAGKHSGKTLSKAIDAYIADRENVLSPSTIRGYKAIQRLRFKTAMSRRIDSITPAQWQKLVNLEARQCSAKTLKNAWGFISSVIFDATGKKVTVRLPQVVANDLPFLTAEQIPIFLDAIKGNFCETAILLGLSSLRRSEIMAVRWEDIDLDAGCIYVHGSAVIDADGNLIHREENKNTSSRRTVPFLIPQLRAIVEAADKNTDYVVNCNPNTIWNCTNKACRAAGLPEIGVHGLRRSFASLAYHLGLSEEVTMRAGGWSDIYTMRKIYTKISEKDMVDQGQKYESFFANLNSQKQESKNENCNEKL